MGRLVAMAQRKLHQLKLFSGSKDADKACHVTALLLDSNCGYAAVSFDRMRFCRGGSVILCVDRVQRQRAMGGGAQTE